MRAVAARRGADVPDPPDGLRRVYVRISVGVRLQGFVERRPQPPRQRRTPIDRCDAAESIPDDGVRSRCVGGRPTRVRNHWPADDAGPDRVVSKPERSTASAVHQAAPVEVPNPRNQGGRQTTHSGDVPVQLKVPFAKNEVLQVDALAC